jgi:hypothetical protein
MQMKLWLLDDIKKVFRSATELPPTAQNGNGQNLLKSLARVTDITFPTRSSRYDLKNIEILPNVYTPPVKILRGPRSYGRSELGIRVQHLRDRFVCFRKGARLAYPNRI